MIDVDNVVGREMLVRDGAGVGELAVTGGGACSGGSEGDTLGDSSGKAGNGVKVGIDLGGVVLVVVKVGAVAGGTSGVIVVIATMELSVEASPSSRNGGIGNPRGPRKFLPFSFSRSTKSAREGSKSGLSLSPCSPGRLKKNGALWTLLPRLVEPPSPCRLYRCHCVMVLLRRSTIQVGRGEESQS